MNTDPWEIKRRRDAKEFFSFAAAIAGGSALTLLGIHLYGPTHTAEALMRVQRHNAQLAPIIEEQYPNETNLIVSPDDESFTFTAVDKDGKTLRCYASFESDGAAVTSVGPIVCESIVIDLDQ